MNLLTRSVLLALALAVGVTTPAPAQEDEEPPRWKAGDSPATLAAALAAQVRDIADSTLISRAKKERRISTAVRVAVVAATAYRRSPDEALGIGVQLAAAAAQAAPSYAEVIVNASSFAPALAHIDGAGNRIRTAAFAAAGGPRTRGGARPSPGASAARRSSAAPAHAPTAAPAEEVAEMATANPAVRRRGRPPVPSDAAGSGPGAALDPDLEAAADAAVTYHPPQPSATRDAMAGLSLTAEVSVRHDDNIFWSKTDKIGDTIVSAAPGAEFKFGQNGLAHGSVRYQEAFTRYREQTAPNVNLGTGDADFAYADDRLKLAAQTAYHQLFQNNPDLLAEGNRTLLRSAVFSIDGSAESQLTPKLSAKLGGAFRRNDYQTAGLVTSEHTEWPLGLYYQARPKLDILLGYSYGIDHATGGGPAGRDQYVNAGFRGALTPKLTGELSLGERLRRVGDNPREHILGFDGSFNYELTPKVACVLAASRDFSTSALGESLRNGSYRLGFSAELTPQWQASANLLYRTVDYGTAVFTLHNTPAAHHRVDDYWEADLAFTYNYSRWLSASANYTFRTNRSTLEAVEFNNNLLGLILGLRY